MNKFGGRNAPRMARGGARGGAGGGGPSSKRPRSSATQDSDNEEENTPEFMEDDDDAMMAMMEDHEMGGGQLEEETSEAGVDDLEKKWVRPERARPLSATQDDLVFQQIEIDHYIGAFTSQSAKKS